MKLARGLDAADYQKSFYQSMQSKTKHPDLDLFGDFGDHKTNTSSKTNLDERMKEIDEKKK